MGQGNGMSWCLNGRMQGTVQILYDDAHIFGEAVRCIDEMRAILVPEAKRAPERVERPVQHRMEYRRSINRIALPHWGDSDDRFMLGPTGKWYPKALCLREGDVRLVEWIDKTYSSNSRWLTDLVVDERRRRSGRMEYLVKFRVKVFTKLHKTHVLWVGL